MTYACVHLPKRTLVIGQYLRNRQIRVCKIVYIFQRIEVVHICLPQREKFLA